VDQSRWALGLQAIDQIDLATHVHLDCPRNWAEAEYAAKARQGETGCLGRTVPMEKLDTLVADHIERRLLQPTRLEKILSCVLARREERAGRRTAKRKAQSPGLVPSDTRSDLSNARINDLQPFGWGYAR